MSEEVYICDIGLNHDDKPVCDAGLRHGDEYIFVGEAFDITTRQLRVVYCGLTGPDEDRLFTTSKMSWASWFKEKERTNVGVITQAG